MSSPESISGPERPPAEVYRAEADLGAALRQFERRRESLVRAHGLTPRQYQLLLQIKGATGERARMTELARRLELNQSSVSELLDRVVQAGLVVRTPLPSDARFSWFTLTEEGEARLARAVSALAPERRQLAQLLASLGQAQ